MKVTCPIAPDFPIHPALPPPALPPPTATFQEMKDVRGHDSEGFHMVPDSRHVAHAPCSCDMRLPRPPQVLMTEREEDAQLHPSWEPVQNIYALGDCSADLDRPLPALAQVRDRWCVACRHRGNGLRWGAVLCHEQRERAARPLQVAEQQGKYLAACLNKAAGDLQPTEPSRFQYKPLGSMASVGEPPQLG